MADLLSCLHCGWLVMLLGEQEEQLEALKAQQEAWELRAKAAEREARSLRRQVRPPVPYAHTLLCSAVQRCLEPHPGSDQDSLLFCCSRASCGYNPS